MSEELPEKITEEELPEKIKEEELPEKITEEELPEKITDEDGYLYEKIPVEGRTEILVAGNNSTPLPEYYQKGKGENSMDILGNYDDPKMNEIKSKWGISKKDILERNGYDLTGHIFQSGGYLTDMFKYGHETRRYMKNWVKQITETDTNLYKKIGKDPNYKPPQKYNSNYNDYDSNSWGNSWGGRKHRRNSKKRNTKRRNSKKRRSHKRR
jgi:hypothetical protein